MAGTDVLTVHAREAPDRIAVIVDDSGGARPSRTTYAELDAAVNRLAHGLLAVGARPGDRLVWCGPN
ncbi:MAG: AMP-binding protein [Actinomycetota bacterium]